MLCPGAGPIATKLGTSDVYMADCSTIAYHERAASVPTRAHASTTCIAKPGHEVATSSRIPSLRIAAQHVPDQMLCSGVLHRGLVTTHVVSVVSVLMLAGHAGAAGRPAADQRAGAEKRRRGLQCADGRQHSAGHRRRSAQRGHHRARRWSACRQTAHAAALQPYPSMPSVL